MSFFQSLILILNFILLFAACAFAAPQTGSFTDSRDGKTYKTVSIGKQTWMAENLDYEYNEGSAKSHCNSSESRNCDKYARLYTWDAAMNVCPEGWHLPDTVEWNALLKFVGNGLECTKECYVPDGCNVFCENVGKKLKSTVDWKDRRGERLWDESGNGTDAFGFAALPVDTELYTGLYTRFWSSVERAPLFNPDNHDYAYCLLLSNDYDGAILANYVKSLKCSVRCIKD